MGLSFAVAEDDPALDSLADHVSAELEEAFTKLWARLEAGPPEARVRTTPAAKKGGWQ